MSQSSSVLKRPAPRSNLPWSSLGRHGPRRGGEKSTGEVTELVQDTRRAWEAGDGIFAHE